MNVKDETNNTQADNDFTKENSNEPTKETKKDENIHNLDIDQEKFQCDICITKFDSTCLLKNHMKMKHKQDAIFYVYSNCKFTTKTEAGRKRHENLFCELCNIVCLELLTSTST